MLTYLDFKREAEEFFTEYYVHRPTVLPEYMENRLMSEEKFCEAAAETSLPPCMRCDASAQKSKSTANSTGCIYFLPTRDP